MVHVAHDPRVLVIVGIFCIGFGGYHQYKALCAKKLVDVSASDLEAGMTISSPWLRIHGQPRGDLSVHGSGDDHHRTLIPVVSSGWSRQQPIAIFIESLERDGPVNLDALGQSFTGFQVIGRGIGGNLRDALHGRELRDGDNAIIVTVGATPNDIAREGRYWMAGGGGAILLFFLIPKRWRALASFKRPWRA